MFDGEERSTVTTALLNQLKLDKLGYPEIELNRACIKAKVEIFRKRELDGQREGYGLEGLIYKTMSMASGQISFHHIATFLLQRYGYTIKELVIAITNILHDEENIDMSSQEVKQMLGFSF